MIGVRNWALYACIALPLGFLLHFISFYRRVPSAGTVASALLVTFFFVAIPEEAADSYMAVQQFPAAFQVGEMVLIGSIFHVPGHRGDLIPAETDDLHVEGEIGMELADGREAIGQFIHARMIRGPEHRGMAALRQGAAQVEKKKFTAAARTGTAADKKDSHAWRTV